MTAQSNIFKGTPKLLFSGFSIQPGTLFTVIIFSALLAFEAFNYSTTDYALTDLLGKLTFAGLKWSTILAIAFCGIDFAGIARLFTPDGSEKRPTEVWYLFGAWFLAATMNAVLTWWGVSMALVNHPLQSSTVMDPELILKGVPVFVAIMVWLIRILIIGSLSMASDRLFGQAGVQPPLSNSTSAGQPVQSRPLVPTYNPVTNLSTNNRPASSLQSNHRESLRQQPAASATPAQPSRAEPASRAEPVYTGLSARPSGPAATSGNTRRL